MEGVFFCLHSCTIADILLQYYTCSLSVENPLGNKEYNGECILTVDIIDIKGENCNEEDS